MYALQLMHIGEDLGVCLPEDLLARLKLQEGDQVFLLELPGGLFLTARDSEIEAQLKAAAGIMEKRRVALRELAKPGDATSA